MVQHHIPLFFTYHERVFGNGFLADIASRGRILCATELTADDQGEREFWVYGVEPGSLAASGNDPDEAFKAFRKAFRNALLDLAEEAASFDAFEVAAKEMFHEINGPRELEWRAAVDAVRDGRIDLDIRRESAESVCYVKVQAKQLPNFSPDDNYPTTERALAA